MKNKLKIIIPIIILVFLALFIYGFIKYQEKRERIGNNKIKIITTIFPTYDFTKNILGDKGDVELLLKPGVEPHAFAPTPNDIKNINNADIFIYTNNVMEPWVSKIVKQAEKEGVKILDVSKGIDVQINKHKHENANEFTNENDSHCCEEDHEYKNISMIDPHIWVNPEFAKQIVKNILDEVVKADKNNKEYYKENADKYLDELDKLDKDFIDMFNKSKIKEIVFAGHVTFSYFADRYGINIVSVYLGFSPDAEPSVKKIAEIMKHVKEHKPKYIFHEELVNPRVAKLISDETKAKVEMLHGLHNLTKDEFAENKTYLSIMRENMEKLRIGLK